MPQRFAKCGPLPACYTLSTARVEACTVMVMYSRAFEASRNRLDPRYQEAVVETAQRYLANPGHPGLNVHPISGARDPKFLSVRVNHDVRLIVHNDDGNVVLCYVDHHDSAYRWAETHTLTQNEQTGSLHFDLVDEAVEAITTALDEGTDEAVRPFAELDREYLLKQGVPGIWIRAIRTSTEDQFLDEIMEHLPEEAADVLLEYAASGILPPLPAPPVKAQSPYHHPDTLRRFKPADDAHLEQALA